MTVGMRQNSVSWPQALAVADDRVSARRTIGSGAADLVPKQLTQKGFALVGRSERVGERDSETQAEPDGDGRDQPEQGKPAVPLLRAQVTSFIGRVELLQDFRAALDESRLVTLLGPGGVGKTRVLEQLAALLAAEMDHRVVVVYLGDLKPDEDDEHLAAALASAMGLPDTPAPLGVTWLVEYLCHQRLTLMLDNCEHLTGSDGDGPVPRLLRTLLRAANGLRVVATSRDLLGVKGERRLVVPPLCVGDEPYRPDGDGVHEALRLLIDRSRAVGTEIVPADYGVAHRLCRRLDGNALAIELAAGQLDTMSIDEILAVENLLDVLVDGDSDQINHRTLRMTMDSSYQRLSEDQQRMWAVLAVFEGGVALEAAQAVCGRMGIDEATVLGLLRQLVRKSVVKAQPGDRRTRYRLLEGTSRQFGLEKITAAGEDRAVRLAHADYYCQLVARGAGEAFGPHEVDWMVQLGEEFHNIRSAHKFLLCDGDPDLATRGLELAINAVRSRFPIFNGMLNEVSRWLAHSLTKHPAAEPSLLYVAGLSMSSWVAMIQGAQDVAGPILDQAERAASVLGCGDGFAPLLRARATWAWLAENDVNKAITALPLLRRAEHATRQAGGGTGDDHLSTLDIGMWAAFLGDSATALAESKRVLADAHAAAAPWSISWGLWTCSLAELQHGEPDKAMSLIQETLEIQNRFGDQRG
ncbi:LuxR family transcriptional regulator [Kibdelosporangium lantanae]